VPSTFVPVTDIPIPIDYVLGPGDTVNVQLFGNQNNEYFLSVSREGTINFPEIGPINVSGLSFAEMRDTINERIAQQMIGVSASITLGKLWSIRVFVLGDVVRPGSYTVISLSTITNALFASGGVKPIKLGRSRKATRAIHRDRAAARINAIPAAARARCGRSSGSTPPRSAGSSRCTSTRWSCRA
jgi:protein involved in polysaccharide export with SLBB domain